jgi:hypothetical protein
MGNETWTVTLREENRPRVFENRMLRMIIGPKRNEVTGEWSRLINASLMICSNHKMLFGLSNQKE